MVKRTQSLPLNTIILAIIAIVVLVFLILIFTGGIGKFISSTNPLGPSSNQTKSAQCSEYGTTIETQIGTSTDSAAQLQMLANSQYVTSGCSIYSPYSFTLYNGSQVVCGLGPKYCIVLSSSGSSSGSGCPSSCTPPDCIPGCELK
jgi:hypothetical protein